MWLCHSFLSAFSVTQFCWFWLFLAQSGPLGKHHIQLSCFAKDRNEILSWLRSHAYYQSWSPMGASRCPAQDSTHLAVSSHLFVVSARHPSGLCLVKVMMFSWDSRVQVILTLETGWVPKEDWEQFPGFVFYRFSVSLTKLTRPGRLYTKSENSLQANAESCLSP